MPNAENRGPVVNVFLADGSTMGCELMAAALVRSRYRFAVTGYSTDLARFRAVIDQATADVDVALISASLKDGPVAGFQLTRELRDSCPQARIIALLDSSERSLVVEAFRAGASGILSREQPFDVVCKCIHAVYQGQVWASSKEVQYALDALTQNEALSIQKASKTRTVLTKREEGVVRLVSEGFTNRDISQQLNLSENTVRNYLFRIFNKVGASNRLELALYVLNRKGNPGPEVREPGNGSIRMGNGLCSSAIDET